MTRTPVDNTFDLAVLAALAGVAATALGALSWWMTALRALIDGSAADSALSVSIEPGAAIATGLLLAALGGVLALRPVMGPGDADRLKEIVGHAHDRLGR